ncbi:2OG-Fe(II) oxygenase [Sulfurimonas paralvinellae]|uniref:2OG-Fe(II) oxygenase n=1 Tax=Sulfurimonas paralvinellae TaxID=317658 RepID=A0A7M1BAZ2_9BACT|nr:2OG-Fe(II) oxygenase [Sulfurimonas paralvinellae]QOP46596.1 2OG-Fe(II) oxygenase [Sulfurimonas paralvinellae]
MNYETLYEKITSSLITDGYIVIEDALSKYLISELLTTAKQSQNFQQAGISASNQKHIDENRRRDQIAWLDEDGSCVSEYLSFINGLREYLNRSLYLGLSYYEAHFARYKEGNFYEKHLDAFKNFKNRVVTTVLYLNEDWSEEDGGELLIYDKADNVIETVIPHANTLVVFMSEEFPHAVEPAKKDRYSIAGWFRVDKR